MKCPRCESTKISKNGRHHGKQNYVCKHCGRQFVESYSPKGYSDDVNGSGKLHRSVLGIPTEEFGFSQNPRIVAGPPKFGDSAVFVAGSETDIQIQLQSF